ncbi:MAG: tetratricopeptide repeat protein [Rhizomicrobium sp.]
MTDIFQEVEEDVRRERLEQFWKKYSDYIYAGVALVIIAVASFELWTVYEKKQQTQASEEYLVASRMLQSGQSTLAAEMLAKLAKTAPGGYAAVSRLQEADALLNAGNRADALALYRQIADGNDPQLGAIARIHLAWALVDEEPEADVKALLAPADAAGAAWSPLTREVLAYADYRAGDSASAIRIYNSLVAAKTTPEGLRQRAQIMAQFLAAGGDAESGKVPPPLQNSAQTPGGDPAAPEGPPSK